jgi:hypothetical protein
MNKRDVRSTEFAMLRQWAEKQTSESLKSGLSEGTLTSSRKIAAREVLKQRGEL